MKTTEIFVEQVLIGLLVFATARLPFLPASTSILVPVSVGEGAVLLGIGYLLGILFDRLGDTLSYGLEQRGRLAFAAQIGPEDRKRFREDALVVASCAAGEGVGQRIEYLRSRIRLARALAIFLPATATAVALHLAEPPRAWAIAASACVVALYVLALHTVTSLRLPRTEDEQEYLTESNELRETFRLGRDPYAYFAAGVLFVGVLAAAFRRSPSAAASLAVGALLVVLAVWTFLRVRRTFMRFLLDAEASGAESRRARNAA